MTQLNLSIMISEAKSRLHRSTLPDSTVTRWLNMGVDRIFREIDLDHSNHPISLTTVADQSDYYIECAYRKIKGIVNIDEDDVLSETSVKSIRTANPSQDTTGIPYSYAVEGIYEALAQPASVAVVSCISSNASDNETVRISGELNGISVSDTITLNGLSSVSTTQTFDKITRIRKSGTTSGYITVTSGAITLVIIPYNKLRRQYIKLIFDPTPSDAYELEIYALALPWEMESSEDVPDLPEEFHSLVLDLAIEIGHRHLYEHDIAEVLKKTNDVAIQSLKVQQGNTRNNSRVIKGGLSRKRWGPRNPPLASDS